MIQIISKKDQKKLTSGDILNVFIRSNFFQGSWNFERMQALGFCFSILPVIKRLYPENNDDRKKAIKRHLEFFNTHPYVASSILGITMAMEEERVNGAPIEDSSISSLKIGLMGPLAGVGDPVFWGTIRPILAALGASIALSGNFLGPILFFFLFNLLRLIVRYYGIKYGYKKGIDLINEMGNNNLFKKMTEGASILGLFIMGALVNKWTRINIPIVISKINDSNGEVITTTVQSVLDQLMPGLAPLLLTFICIWFLNRRVDAFWIILCLFMISILGCWAGFLNN